MNFEKHTFILPEFWAPAIFYGDDSSFTEEDVKSLDEFLDNFDFSDGHWSIDPSEPYFTHDHDAPFAGAVYCRKFYWYQPIT